MIGVHALSRDEEDLIREYLLAKGLPAHVGVTFDDVYIPEGYSEVRSRSEIFDFSTYLAENFRLQIPIVSANMETVTGVEMTVGMAREGGLGFLPQTLPIKDRLEMLTRVKRTDCAFIERPLSISPQATLREAKNVMRKYGVSSMVLVNGRGKPVGILTNRDWCYEKDESKTVFRLAGATGRRLCTAPKDIPFDAAGEILKRHKIEKLPLVDTRGRLAGLITAHGLFYHLPWPNATRDDKGRFVLAGSIGVGRRFTREHLLEVELQAKKGIRILLVDTARAMSVNVKEAMRVIRKNFPHLILVVGNVSSAEGAKALFEWGADAIKVNQGRGHVCRTSKTGVGQPQLTAIAECSVIARRYKKRVIADGGMKNPGDLMKAVVAGADVLMTGYLVVGTAESAAPVKYTREGYPVKTYVGSASLEAQRERIKKGTLDRIREPEGVAEDVPVVGTLHERIRSLLDGMRSAMSYFGARNLSELREKGRFRMQSQAGLLEGTKNRT